MEDVLVVSLTLITVFSFFIFLDLASQLQQGFQRTVQGLRLVPT